LLTDATDVVGFYSMPRRDETQVTVDDKIKKFLAKGTAPIYIGFGSIVIKKPEKLTGRF
jgi:hypothetical protein